MAGGLDIIIVGIADKNLDFLASDAKLTELFYDTDCDNEQYVDDFSALVNDPTTTDPRVFYLEGEHLCGWQVGAGLGYVIFDGNNDGQPRKLNEQIYGRIDELKQRFIDEVQAKGLIVPLDRVGVYALNVYDT